MKIRGGVKEREYRREIKKIKKNILDKIKVFIFLREIIIPMVNPSPVP